MEVAIVMWRASLTSRSTIGEGSWSLSSSRRSLVAAAAWPNFPDTQARAAEASSAEDRRAGSPVERAISSASPSGASISSFRP